MNKVLLVGNLGNDPDLRQTEKGHVANFQLATNTRYKDEQGNLKTITEWHDVALWNRENFAKVLRKGMKLSIEGYNKYSFREVGPDKVKIKTCQVVAERVNIESKKEIAEDSVSSEG